MDARQRTPEPPACPTAATSSIPACRLRGTCSRRRRCGTRRPTAADGPLAERLLGALDAAEEAGGDFRGRESATLVVVSGSPDEEPWERAFDLRVDNHAEPLRELRRLYGIAAAYRRRHDFGPSTSLEEEVEIARAAGLPEDQVAVTAAILAGIHGDLDEAAARLRPVADSDPRWREAFERYVRLGFMPQAMVDRLSSRAA